MIKVHKNAGFIKKKVKHGHQTVGLRRMCKEGGTKTGNGRNLQEYFSHRVRQMKL